MTDTSSNRPLVLKFGGSLVEQLGAQLYPSVTATVAELISNAWDADAKNVWVEIPFDEDWNDPAAEITVTDDGHGMTREQAQHAYLVVGRRKRFGPLGDKSEGGRRVHGRKGIGKLAAFGTAGYLECITKRNNVTTAFGIDYDELRRLNPDQDYFVDSVETDDRLVAPNGIELEQGTRVRLTALRVKRKISSASFMLSMSRRFAIKDMAVWINGLRLSRFSIPLQFRLPGDGTPLGVELDDEGWGTEKLPSGDIVRWWIGFTEKPLSDGDQQGLSILARQKMAQRPFEFERSAGTTAQLGFEYLVGEVEAEWLDEGDDIDTDFIQSNRDQLQVENPRLDEFMEWGRARLTWALRKRQELRQEVVAAATADNLELRHLISSSPPRERKALERVADRLMKLPEMGSDGVTRIMQSVVDTRLDAQLASMADDIDAAENPDELRVRALELRAVEARVGRSLARPRREMLRALANGLDVGRPFASIREILRSNPWIIYPYVGLSAELKPISHLPLSDACIERSSRLGQVYVLPGSILGDTDEVIVAIFAESAEKQPEKVFPLHLVEDIASQVVALGDVPYVHVSLILFGTEVPREVKWLAKGVRMVTLSAADLVQQSLRQYDQTILDDEPHNYQGFEA